MSQMTADFLLPSAAPSESHDLASFTQILDHLLERYLGLLHQHQTLQQELSQNLSSAFLSLAQANFQSSNRAHYGQDFYDERMQASLLLCINSSPSSLPIFSLLPSPSANSPMPPSSPTERPFSLGLSSESSSEPPSDPSTSTPSSAAEPSTPSNPRDPLTWFGILVPPALRNAQRSFSHTARDLVPPMAGIVTEMRELEVEVRRVRKKMAKQRLAGKGSIGVEETR